MDKTTKDGVDFSKEIWRGQVSFLLAKYLQEAGASSQAALPTPEESLKFRIITLERVLKQYGEHTGICGWWYPGQSCTCGWEEIKQKFEAAEVADSESSTV